MKLGFIGTGNLATAIIKGLVCSKAFEAENIWAYDIFPDKPARCKEKFGINIAESADWIAGEMNIIIIAVKPADFPNLLTGITDSLKKNNPMIISTAAGTSLKYISSFLNYNPALVRIMPNINATIGEAMSAYCPNENVTEDQEKIVVQICSSIGKTVKLDESYFPMFGVIAGAAPAFAYMFIDELARAGVKIGMNKKLALDIAAQTVLGSAKLIIECDEHPYELIDRVCSPGGTTIEGIAALQEFGFANAIAKAVDRTIEKDKKLESLRKA